MARRRVPLLSWLLLPLLFLVCMPVLSNANADIPFGIDNPFPRPIPKPHADVAVRASNVELVGVDFISDTVFRLAVEDEEGGETVYKWRSLDQMLQCYIDHLNAIVWLCINPTTDVYAEGSVEVSPGEYLPHTGDSMIKYKKFLRKLVRRCLKKGWRVAYWGVHNEPHHDYLAGFPGDVTGAAAAYAELVKATYTVIKNLDPAAGVVLGGTGSNTTPQGRRFYKMAVNRLNEMDPDRINKGYFDYADYHNYNYHTEYKTNRKGLDLNWFRDEILAPAQFADKEIFIKEGGTHTGKDLDAGPATSTYQSESEQAGYLIRRFIYNYAHGASKIQWTILLERDTFRHETHSFFVYIGLTYNGLPTGDEDWFDVTRHVADPKIHIYVDGVDSLLYHFVAWLFEENVGWQTTPVRDTSLAELSAFLSAGELQDLQAHGEIWISEGIEKLSFYAYKLLLDKLTDCDWSSLEILQEDVEGVYVYKFMRPTGPVYTAWWDWFEDPGSVEKVVSLTLPDITADSVLVTEEIPDVESGAEAGVFLTPYPTFFPTATVPVSNHTITLTLGQSPVVIEETSP